jgi:hypothetical protein
MGFFRRAADKLAPTRGRARSGTSSRGRVDDEVARYLTEFVQSRRGVEAYVEPQTIVTQTTMLLVAWDGEWTRRRVPSPQWAYSFAEHHQIPGYDALVVGYPQRMRDYNRRLSRKVGGLDRAGGPDPAEAPSAPVDPAELEISDQLEADYQQPPRGPRYRPPDDPRELR